MTVTWEDILESFKEALALPFESDNQTDRLNPGELPCALLGTLLRICEQQTGRLPDRVGASVNTIVASFYGENKRWGAIEVDGTEQEDDNGVISYPVEAVMVQSKGTGNVEDISVVSVPLSEALEGELFPQFVRFLRGEE